MISVRCPSIAVVALVAALAAASLVAAHDHHHHHDGEDGWRWLANDGKQSDSQALANCLCWNTTSDNWCHHPLDGKHTGFWRDSCARVAYNNTWWWVPVLLWCIYLALTPIFMCLFRMVCNCCGGRNPSYGCCCPISNAIVSADPKFERKYSRCATKFAKILAICSFCAVVTLSVHSFIATSDLDTNLRNLVTSYEQGANDITSRATSLVAEVEKIGQEAPTWMNPATRTVITSQLNSVVPKVTDVVKDLHKAQKGDVRSREGPLNALVALPLALVVVITVLAMCNVRSWCTSIAAGLLSFYTILVVVIASIVLTGSAATELFCNNVPTVTQFAKQAMAANGYCNNSVLTSSINNTQVAFAHHICKDLGLERMVGDKTNVCKEITHTVYSDTGRKIRKVDSEGFWKAITTYGIATGVSKGMTVAACAANSQCSDHADAKAILKHFQVVFGVSFTGAGTSVYSFTIGDNTLNELFEQNMDCRIVGEKMQSVIVPSMCSSITHGSRSFSGAVNRVACLLLALAATFTMTFWIWMNGSKRFTKGVPAQELQQSNGFVYGYPAQCQYQAQAAADVQQGELVSQKGAAPLPEEQQAATSPAVAATAQVPLLLNHQGPNYV